MAATAIPGMGITTTDAFITAPPTIQVITMATATTAVIIVTTIGTTMINRRLTRNREKMPRETAFAFVEAVRFSSDEPPLNPCSR